MIPTLLTSRLVLRPFTPEDAKTVQTLAGNPKVSATTLNIPFPYPDGEAQRWIGTHPSEFGQNRGMTLAICLAGTELLVGAISLQDLRPDHQAELGYWVGEPFWGNGYATEAARKLVQFGFSQWNLQRIRARHLTRNPASGRVMQKVGMTPTITISDHRWKGGHEPVEIYAIKKA